MKVQSTYSTRIAQRIREHGLDAFAGVVFVAARPLALLGAQAAYMLEPLFGGRQSWLHQLAVLLEDQETIDEILAHLQSEEPEA